MRGRGLMLVAGMKMGQAQAQQQAAVEQARQEGAAQAQPAAPSANVTAELQKLAELHKSGVLSDAEFAAAKAKLLG
jgi:membrane protease subunit (stomatin/prohibitin family)